MLASRQRNPITLPPHNTPNRTQCFANAHDFALDQDALPNGNRLQIGDIQSPADPQVEPEARLVDEGQGHCRAKVEQSCGAASVHVAHPVGVDTGDSVAEDDSRMFRVIGRPRVQFEIWQTRGHPLLYLIHRRVRYEK